MCATPSRAGPSSIRRGVAETQAATGAVRRIVQRFFGGSTSKLLAGLVDEGLIDPAEVRKLSRRLGRVKRIGKS